MAEGTRVPYTDGSEGKEMGVGKKITGENHVEKQHRHRYTNEMALKRKLRKFY